MAVKGVKLSGELVPFFNCLLLLWVSGLAFQYVRLRRLGEFLKVTTLFLCVGTIVALLSSVFAINDRPYADGWLNEWDKFLFFDFDWIATAHWVNDHQKIALLLNHAYTTLNWQPSVLFLFFIMAGAANIAWKAMNAFAISLACCVMVFPFAPAVGGYAHFAIARDDVTNILVPAAWHATVVHDHLKTDAITSLGGDEIQGIITMPSFHAAAAVVLAWAFAQSLLLRWPFLILNGLMLASAVPIGGHYIVDIVAGVAIAVAAIWIANRRDPLFPGGPYPSTGPMRWLKIGAQWPKHPRLG